jgi:autotransporter adhesin
VAYVVNGRSTGWSLPVEFFVTVSGGGTGSQGPSGAKGDTGAQGPSGVVASAVNTLTDATSLVNTGGSFTANKTLVGHVSLKAGTYLVTLKAKAAWASGNGEFPQFFVYEGAALTDFSNDLFNVGSGALAQGNASIDSYYNGTGQVTLTEDGDLDIYAFGYNTDHGAGTFSLEDLTVTATQLQLAS